MKLSEIAYRRFKEELFDRRVRPGQLVSQRELVELTGVTLGPMREALLKLEQEGLVHLVPQRGIRVADASLALIRDAFQLRLIVEREAVRHFAELAPEGEIEELLAAHRAIAARAQGRVDDALLVEAQARDRSLHERLVAALANQLVAALHEVNSDRIRLIRLDHGLLTPANLRSSMAEHIAILLACAARDPIAAADAMEKHISTAMRRAMGV